MIKNNKISVLDIAGKKNAGEKITMMTAYDFPGASVVDESGADIILVGDSLAMTVLGHPDTVSVTMDEMLHHCKAVSRGAKRAFLVGDMPFLSYQADHAEAIRNAGRFLKEAHIDAVKVEGGGETIEAVKAIVSAGILVMGHLGLTPQTATQLGGYKVQGKTAKIAGQLLKDALALEAAGCFSIVLEMVPASIAKIISEKLSIPTIGIGAGGGCDGQVLVFHDILGLYEGFVPKFVKQYAELRPSILSAMKQYCADVRAGEFPGPEHQFKIDESELAQFIREIE